MKKYVPSKGDLIALSFNPQSGHEQKDMRPALVVSNTLLNQKAGLAIVCPITRTDRKYPFHVKISEASTLNGSLRHGARSVVSHETISQLPRSRLLGTSKN